MSKYKNLSLDDKKEFLKIYNESKDKTKILCERFNIKERSVFNWVHMIKEELSTKDKDALDIDFFTKSRSTMYDKDGEVKIQWIKQDLVKQDAFIAMKEAIEEICNEVPAIDNVKINESIEHFNEELMTIYAIGDAHIGMHAWAEETGDNFDLKIAEDDLLKAMKQLVKASPESKEAMIIDVGDFFHSDSMDNSTRKSGNALDVDGRWAKVLKVGLNIMVELIKEALTKHEIVHVRNIIGNHNEHSAVFISAFLQAWFRNNDRVLVDESPSIFNYHQFGKCLIGMTHGHTTKAPNLPEIMAYDCEDIWSDTKFRYWYTGHIHHDALKEYRTCKVESFRTLASKDAWHAGAGYRSGRDMKAIVLHKDYGEVQRNTVNVVMLKSE